MVGEDVDDGFEGGELVEGDVSSVGAGAEEAGGTAEAEADAGGDVGVFLEDSFVEDLLQCCVAF